MRHRNKNLVYTDSDINSEKNNPPPKKDSRKSDNDSHSSDKDIQPSQKDNKPTKRKRNFFESRAVKKNNFSLLRRSTRIANKNSKTNNSPQDNEGPRTTENKKQKVNEEKDKMEIDEKIYKKSSEETDEESEEESEGESEGKSEGESEGESNGESEEKSDDEPTEESGEETEDETEENDEYEQDFIDDSGVRFENGLNSKIKKAIKNIFHPPGYSSEQEEFDDIFDDLSEYQWFRDLSDEDRVYYVDKMRELQKPREKIPTIKDIMDMDIGPENIKLLISERMELDEYDKMHPTYDDACNKFMKRYAYITDIENLKKQEQINGVEKEIMEQTKFIKPIRERILESEFDAKTKALIYDKYITMCSSDPDDATKYRTWIDTVLSIPHHPKKIQLDESVPQNIAISELVKKVMGRLNEKVYGMDVAKEEFICMFVNMIANPSSKNKALGLYGISGIGKTMLSQIVAEVMGFEMEKISLGGVTDSSFLEGHGFTYIGSEPGCIAKALIKMKCTNGIIYLDEIDKISKAEKGKEIEHALLHIIDFTQNHNFRDKYMPEIPIDLSNCIFIYSMNSISEFDSALASRIPIIKFDGYYPKEKIIIIEKFILPELLENYNMITGDIIIPHNVSEYIIARVKEQTPVNNKSGVRGLKNFLNSIINRINLYKLASINGKLDTKMSFHIPNFKFPYTLTIEFIKTILINFGMNDYNEYGNMYI